jgi:hypothetical protein
VQIYSVIPPENLADTVSPVVIYAPRAWKQLIRIANNSVGAAQQVNFLFDSASNDSKCYYNGVEMIFIPAPIANMVCSKKISSILEYRFN